MFSESCYVVNASTFLGPLHFVKPVYGFIMPLLVIITTVATLIIISILSKPKMASPTNTVLLAMAVCDLCTIIFPAPWFIYTYTLNK